MKANFMALGLFGLAGATAVLPRDYPTNDYKPAQQDSYEPAQAQNSYPTNAYKPAQQDSYKPAQVQDSYPTKPTRKPKKPAYPAYPAQDAYPTQRPDEYPKSEQDFENGYSYRNQQGGTSSWRPKSSTPEFFNIRVDEACTTGEAAADCPLNGYAIRLEGGIFIATPYNRLYDPKLPIFFVDDDTQMYTVSKEPLQVYIDGITGALKYTKIGWLPPNAIGLDFYHTGNNPLSLVDPSPSYLSWPSTQGASFFGSPWVLCALGSTQQYQVFINSENFGIGGPAGVAKNPASCVSRNLAAVNANPFLSSSYAS